MVKDGPALHPWTHAEEVNRELPAVESLRCATKIQTRSSGIPVVYLAESYIAFFEPSSLSRKTKYGIEQMTTRRITFANNLSIVHLHRLRSAFL